MTKNEGVSGNAVMEAAMLERSIMEAGRALFHIDAAGHRFYREGNEIRGIKILPKAADYSDVMVVVTATIEGEAVVAFHSGGSVRETLIGLGNRLRNGSLKWRTDEFR